MFLYISKYILIKIWLPSRFRSEKRKGLQSIIVRTYSPLINVHIFIISIFITITCAYLKILKNKVLYQVASSQCKHEMLHVKQQLSTLTTLSKRQPFLMVFVSLSKITSNIFILNVIMLKLASHRYSKMYLVSPWHNAHIINDIQVLYPSSPHGPSNTPTMNRTNQQNGQLK